MRLSIEVTGDDEILAELEGRAERIGDARPVLEDIADDFYEIERRRFDSAGEGTWPPLKPATVRAKIAAGLDPRILHATGALRASLTGDAGEALRRVTSDDATIGTTVPHAVYHRRRRPPIDIREADHRRWARMVGSFITTGSPGGTGL